MNILIPDSWLREFLDTDAKPADIQKCLSLCGPSVERLTPINLPHNLGGRTEEGGIKKEAKDFLYDIEITTNRVDCMSVLGIAREAAAILPQFGFKARFNPPTPETINLPKLTSPKIINDPKLCHRIMALKISGVSTNPSPKWLADRLISVGQRPLNALVDITNYVIWEIGYPTHVFDFDRVATGQMLIREAKKGEKITTLDEKSYTLAGGEVVIDNGQETIIDLPSIMGTANSVVTASTDTALFFIDAVDSSRVRLASMTHGIRTQAATMMEKNTDPEMFLLAMTRIKNLIKEIFPQAKFDQFLDIYPHPIPPKSLSLNEVRISLSQINSLIGIDIPSKTIIDLLSRLGFSVKANKNLLTVAIPSWRNFDITIPEDVIEEIARIYGYHRLPSQLMTGSLPVPPPNSPYLWESRVKTCLKYLGFTETYTYSLVENDSGLKLKNPLSSEWQYLRTSLTPSLQKIITENQGKADYLNLFEIAHVYRPQNNDLPAEEMNLIICTSNTDYYRFKGIIETLLSDIGIPQFGIEIRSLQDILVWEIPLKKLLSRATTTRTFHPISKYPPIVEDVNVILSGSYSELERKILAVSNLITHIEVIDKYNDKLTLRITYHSPEKQLSSADIAPLRTQLEKLFSITS
jgi:phenylalanyl-tRNA synthetase beta chain